MEDAIPGERDASSVGLRKRCAAKENLRFPIGNLRSFICRQWDLNPHDVAINRF